ncbi:hypothetical protein AB0E62_00415 [Streptomyces sp. NPDC038707]|uniref:hypothetical protein n=1 Tax=Streptomyces sp. NPDC038707 TaxID=3154329 RepID=UPI003404EC32
MSEGFAGDPYHEGGSQPMASQKGGMEMPHTQMPMQGENSGDTGGNTVTPEIAGWDKTSLKGDHPTTGSNDARKAR